MLLAAISLAYDLTAAMVPYALLAQAAEPKNWGLSWGIILLSVALGLMVTLRPSKRKSEVKRR